MKFILIFLCTAFSFNLHAQETKLETKFTKDAAMERSSLITNISYKLNVDVTSSEKDFAGTQVIDFDSKVLKKDLRVDFKKGHIVKLIVNGQISANFLQDANSFFIPANLIKDGRNEVVVEFSHAFSNAGTGLHRFKDKEDSNVYIYTNFEPQDASRFMPCFDQPDMKATFEFEATVPAEWTVVSTKKEKQVKNEGNGKKKWIFPKTWPMSTYLFSFHGGPFKIWTAKAGKIPLRFFARKSIAKYVGVMNWIIYTKQGFNFFENYFGTTYPFEKYDQLIVPEFNPGAMENIAAVTFSEKFISRGKKTKQQKHGLAGTILHEMAHMWFGDLVTMKWWDDLWLNESFATYMSTKALTESTEFSDSWKEFYSGDKTWAFLTDQSLATHPISTKINTVEEISSIFDGITYGKGASVMKQLAYLIGDGDFQKGLQNYFKIYSYKNATLKDFLGALGQKTKHDLTTWSSSWLETSGVDTLATGFTCQNGKFEKLNLEIKSATPEKPRTHAFETVFLKEMGGRLKVIHNAILKTNKNMEYTSPARIACPDVIYPNYDDYGYFKISLDKTSLAHLKKGLKKTADPFLRMMFWDNLWQMVRDQQMPLQEYQAIFKENVKSETDFENLSRILKTVSGGNYNKTNSIYFFLPREQTTGAPTKRQEFVKEMEALYLSQLQGAKPGSDEQQLWIDSLINATESVDGQKVLQEWLQGKKNFEGLVEQPDRRWAAITKLCGLGNIQSMDLMKAEKARDTSEQAERNVLVCEASQPNVEIKKLWWEKIKDDKSPLSAHQKRSVMENFYGTEQKSAFAPAFAEEYFKTLADNSIQREDGFLSRFTSTMGPNNCDETKTTAMRAFLDTHKDLKPVIQKSLLSMIGEEERCQKIRALASH